MLALGEAAARLIGFAGMAYVARRLGADAYGIVAVAAAIVLYFSHVVDFSVEVMGARAVADAAAVDTLVPPLILARLGIAAACVSSLVLVGLFALPQPDGAMLAATSLTLLAVACSTRFVFLGLHRPAAIAMARVLADVLSVAIIVLLVHDAGDMATVPLSRVVGDGVAVVVLMMLLRRAGFALPLRRAPAVARPILASAAPLVAHAILGLAIFNSDLIFLRWMRGAQTAGVYAAAYTLVSFLLNLGVAYGNSMVPVFTRLLADPPKFRDLYDTSMTQMLTASLPIAAGGFMLARGLMHAVFGSAYGAAVAPLQILIWSVVAAYVRTVVTYALIANGHQAFVLRTTAWSAVANLVLNLFLISRFGMVGAASATLLTELFRTVVGLVYAAQLGMPLGAATRLWRPLVATAAMVLALVWIPDGPVVVAVIGGIVVYGTALALVGGIRMTNGRPALTV